LLGVCSLTAITSPSLFKRHNESRAPSLSRHYPASSVLLAPPTSRPPGSDFGYPYTEPLRPSPATNEISRVTHHNFPHMPSRRPRRADDPGEPICFCPGYSTDGTGLPHLTTGSALSISKLRGSMGSLVVRPASLRSSLNQQVTRLYGFPGGTACEFAILSFWKVFSIHLALRVTPQNRIFASGVNR